MNLRERLAHRLAPHLRDELATAKRAAEHAREANRQSQGRLVQVLRSDATIERQLRATELAATILDRFHDRPESTVSVAIVGQGVLERWHAVHAELTRPQDEPADDDDVTDREPSWTWLTHPKAVVDG